MRSPLSRTGGRRQTDAHTGLILVFVWRVADRFGPAHLRTASEGGPGGVRPELADERPALPVGLGGAA